ncbi:hypothetical protein BDY19DRAFT_977270, partial [Irpex rosettiformis]
SGSYLSAQPGTSPFTTLPESIGEVDAIHPSSYGRRCTSVTCHLRTHVVGNTVCSLPPLAFERRS